MKLTSNHTLFIGLALLSFLYILLRAIQVPLSHDEVATFYYYAQPFEYNFFDGAQGDANNHILNSILSALSFKCFGFSNLSLRLPNVISFLLYIFYVYKIGGKLHQKWTKWGWYITMLLAVNFIQFFGMARGYGISMGFLLASTYYILNLHTSTNIRDIIGAQVFLCLALFANLSLMNVVLIYYGFIFFHTLRFFHQYIVNWKKIVALVFVSCLSIIVLLFSVKTSFFLKENGLLYYGTLDGFWEVTVKSILFVLFERNGFYIQSLLLLALLLFLFVYVLRFSEVGIQSFVEPSFFFFWVLIGSIAAVYFLAYKMQVNFPEDRVGIYFYPLLVGAFVFGVDTISRVNLRKYLSWLLLLIPISSFCGLINFNRISYIPYQSTPNHFFEMVNKEPWEEYPPTIGGYKLTSLTYAEDIYKANSKANLVQLWTMDIYHNEQHDLALRQHPGMYHDFLIAEKDEIRDILPLYDSVNYHILSRQYLYKRKHKPQLNLIEEKNEISTNGDFNNEFFDLLHLQNFKEYSSKGIFVGADIEISSAAKPFRASLVCDLYDKSNNKQISYYTIPLDWLKYKWDGNQHLIKSLYLTNLPIDGAIELKLYIWNMKQQSFQIKKGKVELFNIVKE